jgi:hypothetical protein
MRQPCLILLCLRFLLEGQNIPKPAPLEPARVTGVVVDTQDGRPLRRATVCVRFADAEINSHDTNFCDETDLQGRFTIANLTPARYLFSADRDGYWAAVPVAEGLHSVIALSAGEELTGLKLRMRRLGSLYGRVVFADGEPFPGAELNLNDGRRTASTDNGEYRFVSLPPGDYQVSVDHPNRGDCEVLSHRQPRLYVDRSAGQQAPAIHVDFGEQASGPEIVMVEAVAHRVSGRVLAEAYPLAPGWRVSMGNHYSEANALDGTFSMCNVAPGEYIVRASASVNGRILAGESTIHIQDEDVKNVEIAPETSTSIRARIETEDGAALDLAKLFIIAIPDGTLAHNSSPQSRRESDGSFLITEVYTGEYRFFLAGLPPGSYLKSARLSGQDVVDTPTLIQSGKTLDGLAFLVSSKGAAISGVVQDENGSPVADANVILLPNPPHHNPDVHECSKTSDQNGGFTCDGLAPGKYKAAAWLNISDYQQALGELTSKGTQVEVSERGRAAITLVPLK